MCYYIIINYNYMHVCIYGKRERDFHNSINENLKILGDLPFVKNPV